MAVKVEASPFNVGVLHDLPKDQIIEISMLFANPRMKQFCEAQKEEAKRNLILLDPMALSPEDYRDTMAYLRSFLSLWDNLIVFHGNCVIAVDEYTNQS